MIRKLFFAATAAIAMVSFTSCDPYEPVNKIDINCNMISRTVGASEATLNASQYVLTLDMTNYVASISTSGALIPGLAANSFTLPNIPFEIENMGAYNGYTFEIDEVHPIINGVEDTSITFSDIEGCYTPEVYEFEYTINDGYTTYVTPKALDYGYSNITVTNKMAPMAPAYNTDAIKFRVALDNENNTAILFLFGAQFNEKMPPMDMVFKDLDLKATAEGYSITIESRIPEIKDTPYEDYMVTNLVITLDGTDADIAFTVSGVFQVTGTADMESEED